MQRGMLALTVAAITCMWSQGKPWADADCDGALAARDKQALLRKVLLQPALS